MTAKCVLMDWVMELPIRYQGTLLTAVRGCDTAPKEDVSKRLSRMIRGAFLNTVDDVRTFVEYPRHTSELKYVIKAFYKDCDQYPHHFVMHIVFALGILGYKLPDVPMRKAWRQGYEAFCKSMHLAPESPEEMDRRLTQSEDDKIEEEAS